MKKIFIISIRYTLLSPNFVPSTFLQLKSLGYHKFKTKMLDPERLSYRLALFEDLTLPSLQAFDREVVQDSDDVVFKVLLNASSLLPEEHKEKLLEFEKENRFLEVVFSSEEDANIRSLTINKMKLLHGGEDSLFLTMRMDDDDALSNNFYKNLKSYARKEFSGFGVSFPEGYMGYLDRDGKLVGFRNYNKPKVAIGLCYINFVDKGLKRKFRSIYCFGSHGRLDFKAPVIIDSSFKSFVRSVHFRSDVYGDLDRYEAELENINSDIKVEDVTSLFAVYT